ncbi:MULTISPECIES: NUDIX hydrolase [unclassified Rhizobium]|uniref:NUDIX hydrolase n=1 Tax=unclassified Rhizobium TaxID=2613769 RepID=UPI0007133BA5|nr:MULTISPECIES: NUDIX hydrolase [unclassified Rhizobium]KQS96583.1 ADP-ribose pyrophosphatase [Rhizobium sp. Leaf386]KQT06422.1 ADP-ribose pyrophosphatase [Rhizobium sp. Leaf391]KQT92493.1 ADP-ribose pyrophosphatase [Rhizobium sp. Leaf453]
MKDKTILSSPQLASSAILERDGRYLLVRRANPPSADMYAFPGGRAEPGETPADTAVREFHEETGILPTNPQLFETYDLPPRESDGPGARHFFLSVFKVEADPDLVATAGDDAASIGWYTADEIFALPIPDSVRDCVEKLELIR